MRIEQFRHLITIVEEESMTKAAAKLNISQPALSISMKNLERSLGFELFNKVGRSLTLTQEGEEAYACAKRIVTDLNVMENICKNTNQERHTLNISNSFSLLGKDTLIDVFNLMEKDYITCRFEDGSIIQCIENVFSGISEIGLIRYPAYMQNYLDKLLESKNLDYHILAYENACVVVGEKNPLYHIDSNSINYEHIRSYPFISYVDEIKDNIWMGFFKDLGIDYSRISLTNVYQAIATIRKTDLLLIDTKKDHTHSNWCEDHHIRYLEIEPKIPCALAYINVKNKDLSQIAATYINLLEKRICAWREDQNSD